MPGNPDTVKRKSVLNTFLILMMAIFNSFIKPGSTKQVCLSDFKALTDLQCVISFLFFPLLCQVSNSIRLFVAVGVVAPIVTPPPSKRVVSATQLT